MSAGPMETPAWLMKSVSAYFATTGILRSNGQRLQFLAGEPGEQPQLVFDVGLHELEDVKWPKMNAGTVVKFTARGEKRRLTFLPPTKTFEWAGYGIVDIPRAREHGKAWRQILGG